MRVLLSVVRRFDPSRPEQPQVVDIRGCPSCGGRLALREPIVGSNRLLWTCLNCGGDAGVDKFHRGGVVARTGFALVHRGEVVVASPLGRNAISSIRGRWR